VLDDGVLIENRRELQRDLKLLMQRGPTPPVPLRLKVEINSREHLTIFGYSKTPFEVSSRWFSGSCQIMTYELDELLGTKLRALYQRRKGRDLFDLALALKLAHADPGRIIKAFSAYMSAEKSRITRAMFERNLAAKIRAPQFTADIGPLLAPGYDWDIADGAQLVLSRLLPLLPGELRRRFTLGTFFFDLPTADERETIWRIYLKKYGVSGELPNDEGWTGAEIKECCRKAHRLGITLAQASRYIVPISRSAAEQIKALRQMASGKFISASMPGVYRYEEETAAAGRRVIRELSGPLTVMPPSKSEV